MSYLSREERYAAANKLFGESKAAIIAVVQERLLQGVQGHTIAQREGVKEYYIIDGMQISLSFREWGKDGMLEVYVEPRNYDRGMRHVKYRTKKDGSFDHFDRLIAEMLQKAKSLNSRDMAEGEREERRKKTLVAVKDVLGFTYYDHYAFGGEPKKDGEIKSAYDAREQIPYCKNWHVTDGGSIEVTLIFPHDKIEEMKGLFIAFPRTMKK